jgi:uncharacterized repeat protein (TIGR03803 family)
MQSRRNVRSIHSAARFFGRTNLHTQIASRINGNVTFGLFFLFVLWALPLSAQTYQDLYDFGAAGCCPSPSLMAQGRDGNIYGTTSTGGTANKGTVYRITPAGVLTVLRSFDGTHGATPVGGLTLGLDGNFYGTTEFGGTNSYGTIFKISPAGVLTVYYEFTGTTDGGYPVSPLMIGFDGNFYGTSYPGYAFKMSPQGVFQVITKIPGTTYGPLLQARNGSFYGVTEFNGTHGGGTIYRITGTTATTIHNFDQTTGSYPVGGLVEGTDGNLYGTTTAGGGTNAGVIYRITPAGAYSTMLSFDGVHTLDGYQANAGLIAGADGNLYGATVWGGKFGYGVIFSMTTSGAYSVLYSFDAPHGDGAYATPMQHTSGKIYGTTTRGGVGGMGVVYGFSDGLSSFAELTSSTGVVGKTVGILGRGFSGASSVQFNGTPASFQVVSNTFMTAIVPSGETGFVTIDTTSGNLVSSKVFRVTPQMTGFTPASGKVGDSVQITGAGLIQATTITVGGVPVTAFTVYSDSTVSFLVPAGAKTGTIALTTPGGKVIGKGTFTVKP